MVFSQEIVRINPGDTVFWKATDKGHNVEFISKNGVPEGVGKFKSKINKDTEIYLVDTYGETKYFYNICKTVFLGGSIINRGGQNPLEPVRFGCKILHGPNVQNFAEVYNLLNRYKLA